MANQLAYITERCRHGTERDVTNLDLVLFSQMSDNAAASRSDEDIIRSPWPVPQETSLADPYDLMRP